MKKISGGVSSYRKWAEWKTGDYFKGKLVSVSVDMYKKNNYTFTVVETKFKDGAQPQPGTYMTLNAAGMLDKAMLGVEEGETIVIVYKGLSRIETGQYKGKDSHSMDVFLDEPSKGKATEAISTDDDLLG